MGNNCIKVKIKPRIDSSEFVEVVYPTTHRQSEKIITNVKYFKSKDLEFSNSISKTNPNPNPNPNPNNSITYQNKIYNISDGKSLRKRDADGTDPNTKVFRFV